jgi:CRISPR-associated endonuclease/helicase Cas3
MNFDTFFRSSSKGSQPYPYQVVLAENSWPETLIIPTGFGKTAAILASWLWKIAQGDSGTPRRLVYCPCFGPKPSSLDEKRLQPFFLS